MEGWQELGSDQSLSNHEAQDVLKLTGAGILRNALAGLMGDGQSQSRRQG